MKDLNCQYFFNCVVNISGLDLTVLYLYAGNQDKYLR